MSGDFEQAKSRVCQSEGAYVSVRPLASSWEQRKLGDCFEFLKNNTLSRADLNSENGTARNVHYGDILIKFGDCLDGERSDLPFITDDTVLPKFAGSILREGDVIFADTAEDEAAGKCVELRKLPKEPTISGLHTIPARPRFPFGTGYLGHYLNSDAYHRQLLPLMQGIKVISVSKAALQDTQVRFPSLSEQAAIGAALSEIDNLITLHQRKYDKLAQLKKSMLDKMFPKPGERFPEIRFAGFTDPWEQRKLGELLLERNEQAPQSDQYPLMAFIANQGIAPKGDRYDRSALVNDIEGKLYKRTEKGDFIYSSNNLETGSIGLNKYGNACISPVYCIFQPSGIADSDFLGRRLVRKDFIQEMVKWRQGVIYGQWRIHEADFLRLNIAVPSVDEQRLIGKLLDNLDALITLHQRKLELLRNTKKSLLDRMFV